MCGIENNSLFFRIDIIRIFSLLEFILLLKSNVNSVQCICWVDSISLDDNNFIYFYFPISLDIRKVSLVKWIFLSNIFIKSRHYRCKWNANELENDGMRIFVLHNFWTIFLQNTERFGCIYAMHLAHLTHSHSLAIVNKHKSIENETRRNNVWFRTEMMQFAFGKFQWLVARAIPCNVCVCMCAVVVDEAQNAIHYPPSAIRTFPTVIDSQPYSKYNCSIHFPYLLNEFLCIVSMFLFFAIFPCCLFLYDFINCRNVYLFYLCAAVAVSLSLSLYVCMCHMSAHTQIHSKQSHAPNQTMAWNIHWIYVKHNTYMHLFIQQIEHRNCSVFTMLLAIRKPQCPVDTVDAQYSQLLSNISNISMCLTVCVRVILHLNMYIFLLYFI